MDEFFWSFIFRYLHVLSGVMWIGLLWYFNFVQIPNMPKIPDEQKPAIGKVIAPAALFWFRWGAMLTIITGLSLAMANGYLLPALLPLLATPPGNGRLTPGTVSAPAAARTPSSPAPPSASPCAPLTPLRATCLFSRPRPS